MWEALSRDVLTPLISSAPLHGALPLLVGRVLHGGGGVLVDRHPRGGGGGRIATTSTSRSSRPTSTPCPSRRQRPVPESSVFDLSPARLSRYFIRRGELYEVAQSLRRLMLFAPTLTATHRSPSRPDHVPQCLIYFDLALQEKVLAGFHFGLRSGATLWLGSSEALGHAANSYQVVDARNRFFRTIGQRPRPTWVDDDRVLGRRTRQPRPTARGADRCCIRRRRGDQHPPHHLRPARTPGRLVLADPARVRQRRRITSGSRPASCRSASPTSRARTSSMVASGVPRAIRTGEAGRVRPSISTGPGSTRFGSSRAAPPDPTPCTP
ncbi:MAG: CheR family methyltransferase [Ilumatobacteraceae bacterium]